MKSLKFKLANIILYCKKWEETVEFYRDVLGLEVRFSKGWFVEFYLNESSCLSVADEKHASVKSSDGGGITISLNVEDIEVCRASMVKAGVNPSLIKEHPWGAFVFMFHDPEGNRLEMWQEHRQVE